MPVDRLGPAADPGHPPAPAARLPRGPPAGPERRPAAQPRQDGHGRVIARAALAPAACAALLLAGCGGGGGTTASFTGPDPATVTPADAPLFAEAVVRPEGDQKDARLGALQAPGDRRPGRVHRRAARPERSGRRPRASPTRPTSRHGSARAGVFFDSLTGRGRRRDRPAVTDTGGRRARDRQGGGRASAPRTRAPTTGVGYYADGRPLGRRIRSATSSSAGPRRPSRRRSTRRRARRSPIRAISRPSSTREPSDQLAFAYLQPAGDRRLSSSRQGQLSADR